MPRLNDVFPWLDAASKFSLQSQSPAFVGWAASAHQAVADEPILLRAVMVGTGCPPYLQPQNKKATAHSAVAAGKCSVADSAVAESLAA